MVEDDKNLGRFGEDPDWTWIQENRDFLREKFEGRWIAVLGQEIVGVGDTSHDAYASVRDFSTPLLYHVPHPSEPIALPTAIPRTSKP